MTDKIRNFAVHYAKNKKDKSGQRGFQMLVQRRLRMMKYLLRRDYPEFVRVTNQCGLQREAAGLIKRNARVF